MNSTTPIQKYTASAAQVAPVAIQTPLTDAEIARMVAVVAAGAKVQRIATEPIDRPLVCLGLVEITDLDGATADCTYLTDFAKDCIGSESGTFRTPQFGDFYPCEPDVEAELSRRGGDPIPSVTQSQYDKPESPSTKFLLRRENGNLEIKIGFNVSHLDPLGAVVEKNGDGRFYVSAYVDNNSSFNSDTDFEIDVRGRIPEVYATEPEAVAGACRMLTSRVASIRGDLYDLEEDLKRIAEAMAPKAEATK